MEGLLAEATGIIKDTEKGTMTRDAGLVLAAQKVEHYEISTYGTLRTFAESMGHDDVAELLQQTLDNEKATDAALTKATESFILEQAVNE
jgi:ferritin-like metal-binding protein YciE